METKEIILTKQKKHAKILSESVLVMLWMTGMILSLKDLFLVPWCQAAALTAGGVFLFTVQLMELFGKKTEFLKRIWYLLCLGIFVAVLTWISQGFLETANQFFYLWNRRFGAEINFFAVNNRAGVGAVLMWALLSVGITAILLGRIQKKRMGIPVILGVVCLSFGCICGEHHMWAAVGIFIITGLWLFHYDTGAVYQIRMTRLLMQAAVLAVTAGVCITAAGYGKSARLEEWKQAGQEKWEVFRYGEDTLPKGSLSDAADMLEGEEERLTVDMEQPAELYLRGFVGDSYEKNQWHTLSYLNYQEDYAGMLRWLKSNGLMPVNQYTTYQEITAESLGTEIAAAKVKVENTGAVRKYLYLPATASNWNSRTSLVKKDHNVQSGSFFGAGSYEFTMTTEAQTADKLEYADWISRPESEKENGYLDAEAVYHSFTDTFYKEVTPEQEELIHNLFFPDGTKVDNFQEVTTQIRTILRMQMQYREHPENTSGRQDLLMEFLEQKRAGNASLFASAAVMAYRAAGFPARYVEGYHLSEMQAAEMAETGETTAVLTTRNAHAWVEVYMTGAGWLPVEVVPGMYTETYTTEKVEGRPAYQVNSASEENGMNTARETKEKTGGGKEEKQSLIKRLSYRWVVEKLILSGYLLGVIYLLLELQRVIRRKVCMRNRQGWHDPVEERNRRIARLLAIGKVRGDYSQPLELLEEVQEKFPGIQKEEYERIVDLIQKARFGEKQWEKSELRTVDCYIGHLKECLYENSGRIKKVLFRYLWII